MTMKNFTLTAIRRFFFLILNTSHVIRDTVMT